MFRLLVKVRHLHWFLKYFFDGWVLDDGPKVLVIYIPLLRPPFMPPILNLIDMFSTPIIKWIFKKRIIARLAIVVKKTIELKSSRDIIAQFHHFNQTTLGEVLDRHILLDGLTHF